MNPALPDPKPDWRHSKSCGHLADETGLREELIAERLALVVMEATSDYWLCWIQHNQYYVASRIML